MPRKVHEQKDWRLSGVQVVCYSRRDCPRQHDRNESTCEAEACEKSELSGGCSGLNPRPLRISARVAPAGANLREKLSRWNASLTRSRKLKRIAHCACDVFQVSSAGSRAYHVDKRVG